MQALFGLGKPVEGAAGALSNAVNARGGMNLNYQNAILGGRQNQAATNLAYRNAALGATQQAGTQNLAYRNAAGQAQQQTFGDIFGATQNARNAYAALSPWTQYALSQKDPQKRLGDFYSALGFAYQDPGTFRTTGLGAELGSQSTALPWASADWQGKVTNDATNMNNMFWRNMAASAGSSIGSMAGSGMKFNQQGGSAGAKGGMMGMG